MKNSAIKNTGRYTAIISFLLGNIFLFGYLMTGKVDFALAGYFYLYISAAVNLLLMGILLLYGFFHPQQLPACRKAALVLLINIPAAILYIYIGYNLVIR